MLSQKNKSELAAEDIKEELPIQNLSKEVIEYLSKEIETTTTNMMVYRTKIAFVFFLGPFIILIAVVTKGLTFSLRLDSIAIAAIFVNFLCFLTLAYINARVERQAWLQCNNWRRVIARLHKNPSIRITNDDLFDKLYGDDSNDRLFNKLMYATILRCYLCCACRFIYYEYCYYFQISGARAAADTIHN